jgi:hypothetical protein
VSFVGLSVGFPRYARGALRFFDIYNLTYQKKLRAEAILRHFGSLFNCLVYKAYIIMKL